jgi:hypothetical protein
MVQVWYGRADCAASSRQRIAALAGKFHLQISGVQTGYPHIFPSNATQQLADSAFQKHQFWDNKTVHMPAASIVQ